MNNIRISASSLMNFEDCNKSYWAKYIIKMPEPFSERGALGGAFHDAVRTAYTEQKFSRKEVMKIYSDFRNVGDYSKISDDTYQEGYALLTKWLEIVEKRKWLVKPITCENSFQLEVMPGVTMTGKIDLALKLGDESLVVDWKTARGNPSEISMMRDPQMCIYSLASKILYKKDFTTILCYIRTNGIYKMKFTIKHFRDIIERFENMRDVVRSGKFIATKCDGCVYCPLSNSCETKTKRK